MLIDLTYPLNGKALASQRALGAKGGASSRLDIFGHAGTHLDLMGRTWPEEYFARQGRVLDVRHVRGRDIGKADAEVEAVQAGDFVFFHTGTLAQYSYATREYMRAPVQLSWELIRALVGRKVAMIGVDCAGVRRPEEHREADLHCAGAGTFVVENVYNLEALSRASGAHAFLVRTFPLRLEDATGLPCRIVAEL